MKIRLIHSKSSRSIAASVASVLRSHWPGAEIEVIRFPNQPKVGRGFPARLMVIVDGSAPEGISAEIVAIRLTNDSPLVVYAPDVPERLEIEWLHLGADEVIGAVSPEKFLAIVGALVRRSGHDSDVLDQARSVGDLTLRFHRQELSVHRKHVQLTPTEFRLLEAISVDPGQPVAVADLALIVWGVDNNSVRDSLKVHMSHLRHKLAEAGSMLSVVSERGVGYSLKDRATVLWDGGIDLVGHPSAR